MEKQFARICTAKVNDYSACLPLLTALYRGDIGPNLKLTFEDPVKNEDCVVLLAKHSNKVLGLLVGSHHLDIDWEGKIAKIDALIVDETCRKRGIGTKLVLRFIAMAQSKNCRAVKSRVNRKNLIAQEFHESLGFTEANTFE